MICDYLTDAFGKDINKSFGCNPTLRIACSKAIEKKSSTECNSFTIIGMIPHRKVNRLCTSFRRVRVSILVIGLYLETLPAELPDSVNETKSFAYN